MDLNVVGLASPALELDGIGLVSPVLGIDIVGLSLSGKDATVLVAPTTGDWLPLPKVGTAAVVIGRIPPFDSVSEPVSGEDDSDVTDGCPSLDC